MMFLIPEVNKRSCGSVTWEQGQPSTASLTFISSVIANDIDYFLSYRIKELLQQRAQQMMLYSICSLVSPLPEIHAFTGVNVEGL